MDVYVVQREETAFDECIFETVTETAIECVKSTFDKAIEYAKSQGFSPLPEDENERLEGEHDELLLFGETSETTLIITKRRLD